MEELKRKKEEMEKMIANDTDNLSKEERAKMIEQHEAKLRQLEQDENSKKAAMDRLLSLFRVHCYRILSRC
jgi:hypothetical protein